MTARTDAAGSHERYFATVLELDLDYCANTFGIAPCTATGTPKCYNTYPTCRDRANYSKTVKTYKFCSRGMRLPLGESLYPLITDITYSPAKLEERKGLARNHKMTVRLVDDTASDAGIDPYISDRTQPAGSTFLRRLLGRNGNYVGRFARVRQGYVVDPWDWNTFETRLFILENIDGPNTRGEMTITLKDSLKLAARVQVPEETNARIGVDFKAYSLQGYAAATGGANTVQLPANASMVDDTYNGHGLYIAAGTGFGQYWPITDYSGSTRTVTIGGTWSPHVPDQTSYLQIGPLSMQLAKGHGAKLNDPATTGNREFVRFGKEIIEYTVISGDTISWPSIAYRGMFDTPIEDHKANNSAQQCLVFINERMYLVLKSLLNKAGITDSYIDTTGFQSEDDTWLGDNWRITWPYSKPTDIDALLRNMLYIAGCVMWWDIVAQKVKIKKLAPQFTAPSIFTDEANLISESVDVEYESEHRLTRAGVAYRLINGTEDHGKAVNYLRTALIVNLDEEGANGQNAMRSEIIGAPFLGETNDKAAAIGASNILAHRLNAPINVKFRLDPKDPVAIGDQVDLNTFGVIDKDGQKKTTRILITYVNDRGTHYEVQGRSTIYGDRFAWIAPNTAGDYPADSEYAHISQNDGLMAAGGDKGYGICP